MCKNNTLQELQKWRDRYFQYLEIKGVSKNTIKSYQRAISCFFDFLREEFLGKNSLNYLKWEDFNKFMFLAFLQKLKSKLNEKSQNLYLRIIKNFLKFIAENNEEGIDPYYKIENLTIKEPQNEIITFEENEIDRIDYYLFKKLESTKEYSKYKNLLCILFIRFTGMRAEECLGLKIENISIQEDGIKLMVRGKGNKERILYLDVSFLPYLKRMLNLREENKITSDYLFATKKNKKLTFQGLYRANKKFLQKIGIKNPKKYGLHTYRHTFASLLVNEDVNLETIKEILGHSNIVTTSKYYAKTNEKAKKRSMLNIQRKKM